MKKDTKLVVFEGDDGAGKSTLMHRFAKDIEKTGKTCLIINQDKLNRFGQKIREIVTTGPLEETSSDVRALLFSAYLIDIYERHIQPNWGEYNYILTDRTYLSTLVYQEDSIAIDILTDYLEDKMPIDILVYLKMTPGVGIKRIQENREHPLNTIELESNEYALRRRSIAYDRVVRASNAFEHIVLDADQDADTVHKELRERFFRS